MCIFGAWAFCSGISPFSNYRIVYTVCLHDPFFKKSITSIKILSELRPKGININKSDTVKATIQKFILAVNYTIAVVICLALVTQPQIPIMERALYGFGAIFLGMGIRRAVKTIMPINEDNLGQK